ncbi:MAG TPA: hypothetical protein VF293_01840, partial [Candidatus Limnocylindrales bacterium]
MRADGNQLANAMYSIHRGERSDMPAEEIDLVHEILGPAVAVQWTPPQPLVSDSSVVVDAPVSVTPKRRLRLSGPFARARFGRRQARWVIGFAFAFALAAIACLAVFATVAVAAFNADSNRIVAGVRAGSVDLSGLSRDQVTARLRASYAYLDQGEVTVTTPSGSAQIAYQALGRTPDVEFMADEAMRIGHSGNPIGDAVDI